MADVPRLPRLTASFVDGLGPAYLAYSSTEMQCWNALECNRVEEIGRSLMAKQLRDADDAVPSQ